MKQRILLCLLAFCLVFAVGCKRDDFSELDSSAITVDQEDITPPKTLYPNPLTGLNTLEENNRNLRPVAVMVNNISTAQPVQCGLNDADLVFECLVEGGISRLMAVYYDVKNAQQIGSVRSARYTYVELCRWLDALYVHHGSDMVYTHPYMRSFGMDNYEVDGKSGYREDNGLAWEHRLYTSGNKLLEGFASADRRTTSKKDITPSVFQFASQDAPVTPATPCNRVTYAMSSSYKTTFIYDPETKTYSRNPFGNPHSDYKTGDTTVIDNILILYANSPLFEDGYHLRTVLSSGDGLYVSQGGCQEIKWKKGEGAAPLILTDANGNELTLNAGRSWIAFPPVSSQSKTVVE